MQPPEHEQPSSSSAAPPADAGGAWRRTHARHEQQQQQRVPRSRVVRIKVISMGDVGAGKSCLIKRYCEEKFASKYVPTIGIDYGVKPVRMGDHELRVNLWDLSGAPAYADVRNEFYRDAQAALLCFDVAGRAGFEGLGRWLREARQHGAPPGMAVFVVGTKAEQPGRRVSEAEGREWAAAQGCTYREASAATGRGVAPLFASLFSAVVAQLPQVEPQLASCAVQAATAAAAADGLAGALQLC